MARTRNRNSRVTELVLSAVATLVLCLLVLGVPNFSGGPDVVMKPANQVIEVKQPTSDIVQSAVKARAWPQVGGDFGPEGLAAQLITTPPSSRATLRLLAADPENPAARALAGIIHRHSRRTGTKYLQETSLKAANLAMPSVMLVSCNSKAGVPLDDLSKECTTGNLLLIPSDMLHEGLLVMGQLFNYNLGDLLYLEGGPDYKRQCADDSFYNLAMQSLVSRLSALPTAAKDLNTFNSVIAALPNYCQGMYPFSQCQLLKKGGNAVPANGNRPSHYSCNTPTSKPSMELVADDKAAVDAAKALVDTAWPACKSRPKGCAPTYGIAFVKTHKTASSTLEGILHRLCLTRRQRCLTHSGKFLNLAYPEQAAYVAFPHKAAPALSAPYEMFVAHTMNSPELLNNVPTSNGHILTIVREANKRFKSHWNYWVGAKEFVAPGFPWKPSDLEIFCKNVTEDSSMREVVATLPLNIRPALNNMARQLMGCTHCGTPAQERERFDKLLEAIKAPDSKYHVMISEKLHESLVLVKRDYGLEMADLLYSSRNAGSYKRGGDSELMTCLKKINSLDDELFEVAMQVHNARVQALGEPFQEELQELERMIKGAEAACNHNAWGCNSGTASPLCEQCNQKRGKVDAERTLVTHFKQCTPL